MNSRYVQMLCMLKEQIRPALGCTEPGSVAYAAAVSAKTLGIPPEMLTVSVSRNILKNAMGVGIPGTDQIGLPIAAALGALDGDADAGLAALHDMDQEKLRRAQTFVDERRVQIQLNDTDMKLYIDVLAKGGGHSARTVIAGSHTHIVLMERDGLQLDVDQSSEEGSLGACSVGASIGTACALTYMAGGTVEQIGHCVDNVVADVSGVICDGAKAGCSLKIATGVSSAFRSSMLAMKNRSATATDGIVGRDPESSVDNLANLCNTGMQDTDRVILDMLVCK